MQAPLISVIIPCYNAAAYVSHALDAMLAQTYPHIEIIVVNDQSTDGLEAVVQPYLNRHRSIRSVSVPYPDLHRFDRLGNNINAGFLARNVGVEHARGDYITFQDADDGSCANRIAVQYDLMQQHNAYHVNVDWQQYRDELNGKPCDAPVTSDTIIGTEEILALAKRTERHGMFRYPFGKHEDQNPFARVVRKLNRKLFFQDVSYPCAASMPLVRREVFDRCRFLPLWERRRPSGRGRGADQDFNFWVAETFQKSIAAKIPLVLWRVQTNNPRYEETG